MQKKIGISLIVLVITIIVMVILAGAIVLTLNNSGIIAKAEEAVEQTNLATVRELTQMAWAEAYAGGERTQEGLKAAVDKSMTDNKIDTSKYVVEVTEKGVTVELIGEQGPRWVQKGLTVTNGSVTLEIGDKIAYEATGSDYEGEWQVLGANEQGELLILSTDDVVLNYWIGEWLNAVSILDGLCEPYGKGEGATGARSIRIEDVDKITGYDKTTYGKGTLNEYGNEVTYLYGKNLTFTATNGSGGGYSNYDYDFYGFRYYDGEKMVEIRDWEEITYGTTLATIKCDYYTYNATELDNMDTTSKEFIMLFGEYDQYYEDIGGDYREGYTHRYWLASYLTAAKCATIPIVCNGIVVGGESSTIYYVEVPYYNGYSGLESDVRAVVSLEPTIQLEGSSETGWTY